MEEYLPNLNVSPADEVKTTTCYMCACRCGIKVHLKNGDIRYIEGNVDHPVNKGVLCAKGSAGIMHQHAPSKLQNPLLRVGERGQGEFKEISWDEALELATGWLQEIRSKDPKHLAFYTGRDQSQSLTGWWANQFGTPNFAAHGGFCSVNMAAAGLYTIGGSFWEFGEPDWDEAKYFMMFGVAEDHDSNPIKIGLGTLKKRKDTRFVAVNPVRTGYGAIADEWVGICPGTDGLFISSIIYELLYANKIDSHYLARYANASWLVINEEGKSDHGLFLKKDDIALVMNENNEAVPYHQKNMHPQLIFEGECEGRSVKTVFMLLLEQFMDEKYNPERVAETCGISAERIRTIACDIADANFSEKDMEYVWEDCYGDHHQTIPRRPVSFHAMRGISAHSNGFNTCRLIHVLQTLLGAIDRPGSYRYEAPFPKPAPPGPKPAGKTTKADTPLGGMPLGFPHHPSDLLLDEQGQAMRIDKGYSWDFPLAAHGLMHMILRAAWEGTPYKIDVLFMYMANMAWNSAMNTNDTLKYLTDKDENGDYKIPKIIYSDAFYSEMVSYADLILPDTTYLERWDCISLLDRPISNAEGPADAIRQPVIAPNRNVRPFQDVLLDLGARLHLPGMVNDEGNALYKNYADYIVHHERTPSVGPLAGFRGKNGDLYAKGEPNDSQLQAYIDNGCFYQHHWPKNALYMRNVNKNYQKEAVKCGFLSHEQPIVIQIYSDVMQHFRLAAMGFGDHQPPEEKKERIKEFFTPLPFWYTPLDKNHHAEFPFYAVTQRPMQHYHSWGSHNAWLRQLISHNRLYMNRKTAQKMGFVDEQIVVLESRKENAKVTCALRLMDGVHEHTVWTWNAIGKRKNAWGLKDDAKEATKGFLLNPLIDDMLSKDHANADPVTGQAAWYDLKVSIRALHAHENVKDIGTFEALKKFRKEEDEILRYGQQFEQKNTGNSATTHIEWIGGKGQKS